MQSEAIQGRQIDRNADGRLMQTSPSPEPEMREKDGDADRDGRMNTQRLGRAELT
jgi:hypothetical protein